MVPDLGLCPLAAEAAMALLSIYASASQAHPSSGTTEEGEERHQSLTSSTQAPTGGGEPQPLPISAAARETRELEEEASRREAAAAGRGRGRPRAGAARGGQSDALRPLGRVHRAGHGGSSRPSREEKERHWPPTGSISGDEPQPLCETHGLEEEASRREAAGAGRDRRRPCSGAPRGGESETLAPVGRARGAAHGGNSHGSSGARRARSEPRRPPARAGMARRGLGKARGGAGAMYGIDHGGASASVAVTHDNKAVSDEDESEDSQYVLGVIESLKTQLTEERKQLTKERFLYIKNRAEENKRKLSSVTRKTDNSSVVWQRNTSNGTDVISNLLTSRQDNVLSSVHSLGASPAEKDGVSSQEETLNGTTVMLGGNLAASNVIGPIILPEVLKHPRSKTWTFVYRNQRMAENQSVFGRRKIYNDADCGEALIYSDSEDEAVEDEEEKNEFERSEDFIIWRTIEECGMSDTVLETLAQYFDKAAGDIKARYEILHEEKTEGSVKEMSKPNAKEEDVHCDKDLDAALDSFDNLFCRRCLVFDCRLHGCSQDLVFPTEKQSPWNSMDDGITCGIQCYKLASKLDATTPIDPHMIIDTEPTRSSDNTRNQLTSSKKKQGSSGRNAESQQSENFSTQMVASESSDSEVHPTSNKSHQISPKGRIKKKIKKRIPEQIHMTPKKKRREVALSDPKTGGCPSPREMMLRSRTLDGHKDSVASSQQNYPSTRSSRKKDAPQMEKNTALGEDRSDPTEGTDNEHSATYGHDSSREKESVDGNICRQEENGRSWKVIEQGLLLKGLEIFGRNSCLIARNLLSGMKSCSDIFQYMNYMENSSASGVLGGVDSLVKGHIKGPELSVRSRFFRRRKRVRRVKHTSKSAGYHFIRKRIAESKDQLYQQYNPCGCQSACGKECPCLTNETCCEKYCGCPKTCKNRFRGCHCAKSQCRSRQCPCFAADRECDPDVCRNCWVGCGDGSLGFPNRRGDNYECRNMKVLLKQQQRILLGKSDVCGWGAFLKNTVGKDEFLGEYTGELISHTEAGMRGTLYDRANSSFLFNLNNEFVLDALRMGNKLKFANHSNDPNCYAKVLLVAGDHRVGIFAKERIGTGEEIFYDYHYAPDEAPVWARKPDAPGAKDPGESSSAQGKKSAH